MPRGKGILRARDRIKNKAPDWLKALRLHGSAAQHLPRCTRPVGVREGGGGHDPAYIKAETEGIAPGRVGVLFGRAVSGWSTTVVVAGASVFR